MAQPQWITPAGSLGTVAENIFVNIPVIATDSDGGTVKYLLVAGSLPEGVQIKLNGTIEGVPTPFVRVKGVPTEVSEDVVNNFVIRAYVEENGTTRINDRTFALTVTGQDIPTFVTPAGSLGTFYDGDQVDLTIQFSDSDPADTVTVALETGKLPPGLSLSTSGKITGYITPVAPLPETAVAGFDRETTEFDEFPFDFTTRSISLTYEFTLSISDGKEQNLRTFSMYVVSKDSLTADTDDFTGDTMLITADVLPARTPIIINFPSATTTTAAGFIGTYRHDNFFAYQIQGLDLDGDQFEFEIESGDSADLPPGIALNRSNGWLTGYFPDAGATETTYSFGITIYKKDNPLIVSTVYNYSITVIGDIENAVTWLSGTLLSGVTPNTYSLGTVRNGSLSLLAVEASTPGERVLLFRLKPGAFNRLPQGLSLLPTGAISGRVSFNGFALDGGTTTFDESRATRLEVDPTTFDSSFTFTVNAYTADGLISVFRTFRITVDRYYNVPYESLYIEAMPPQEDRDLVNSLLLNQDIFDPAILFRPSDPYFGVSRSVQYVHAFGTSAATLESYVEALSLNHFKKQLILGGLKTAQALDANDNVIYEVVYSEIVDTGVNQQGKSPAQKLKVPYPFTDPNDGSSLVSYVYPNSLINMRDQVIDTVGQTSTELPLWMQTKQTNGRVLGFTKAWVIAYTLPGESAKLAYNIRDQFGEILNRVDFISDRYILDNQLTKNWVPNEDSTDGGSWLIAKQTTFDTDVDISGLYVSTSLVADATNGAVFDRSLTVNGILVVAAGAVGGQLAVPDEWVKKVGRSYQLIMDPDATGIDSSAQKQMIRTLNGLTGTWHAGFQTAQRVGYGGGSSYSPNWLTDIGAASYAGYTDFLAQHAVNDMVWYKNNNGWNGTGIKDVEEVFEHIMHTIHLYGVRGGVQGSVTELNWDSEDNPGTYTGTELFKAMEQAIDNGMYDAGALDPYDSTEAHILMKEYMYLLNWGMWEMSVFWAGGSLAPEWNDLMRTPAGILANNPLGYALFNTYFAPVLSKPNFATLNSIFQDNDQGLSGYRATSAVNSATTFDGNSLRFNSPVDTYEYTDEYNKYLLFPKTNILI